MISYNEIEDFRVKNFHSLKERCKCKTDSLREANFVSEAKCKCAVQVEMKTRLKKSCIPSMFWDVKSKDLEQKDILINTIKPYVNNLNKALKNGCGLFFTGPNGTGKTQMMSFIAKRILYKTGYSCYYITAMQLTSNILKFMKEAPLFGEKSKQELFDDLLLNVDFLFLDELGKEPVKDFNSQNIERILRYRLDNQNPTIISSNLSIDGLNQRYDDTIVSIISGSSEVTQMDFEDRRLSVYMNNSKGIYGRAKV